MIDYLTFIDELKELKPVVVSLDDTIEDTDTKINKLIEKYETIMTEHEKEENNEPSIRSKHKKIYCKISS